MLGVARSVLGLSLLVALSSLTGCAASSEESDDDGAASGDESALTIDPGYAAGHRHSVMSGDVVAKLRQVVQQNHGDDSKFAKVGDSITFSEDFLTCLSTKPAPTPDLEAARSFFDTGSFERRTQSAVVGWHTWQPLGTQTANIPASAPMLKELDFMKPTFAVVMLGTNDDYLPTYRIQLGRVIDTLLAHDVVPLMSTIPPSLDPRLDPRIPGMNDVVRQIASSRKVPLMDFHAALDDLPRHGISADKTHPNKAPGGACDFSTSGLQYGYNVRNKIVLEALARAKHFILDGAAPET